MSRTATPSHRNEQRADTCQFIVAGAECVDQFADRRARRSHKYFIFAAGGGSRRGEEPHRH